MAPYKASTHCLLAAFQVIRPLTPIGGKASQHIYMGAEGVQEQTSPCEETPRRDSS